MVSKCQAMLMFVIAAGLADPGRADMLVRYTFDEASSGTSTVINQGTIGSAADATFGNSATRTSNTPAGYPLGALDVTANESSYLVSGTDAAGQLNALDAPTALTVTFWLNERASSKVGVGTWVSKRGTDASGWAVLSGRVSGGTLSPETSSNSFHVNLVFPGSSFNGWNSSTAAVTTAYQNWTFIALTWSTADSTVRFYTGTTTSAATQLGTGVITTETPNANSVPVTVGNHSTSLSLSDPAWMDDVRIYNGVLSLGQLETIRLENIPEPATLGLVLVGGAALLRRRQGHMS